MDQLHEKARIMDAKAVERAIQRIGYEIIEHNRGTENIVLIGIQRRGVPLAQSIAEHIRSMEGVKIPIGTLDVTFYRDDLSILNERSGTEKAETDIPFSVTARDVILVDDVLFTGRTVRAAMEALIESGRPRTIQLAVLIDRGHRELPIHADYVGKNVPTSHAEFVSVRLPGFDGGEDGVVLLEKTRTEGSGGGAHGE
ncbi:MAG: bifunctional pyr operon transcriptional regulator/uracil phosphoribosyltransferase PyrR [Fretibacterium sp.]|nr:bifunctional pyr operon transcriptional regulator/uracil phosphoribosyltransferase PyrR [Fretibacterium sp.]